MGANVKKLKYVVSTSAKGFCGLTGAAPQRIGRTGKKGVGKRG